MDAAAAAQWPPGTWALLDAAGGELRAAAPRTPLEPWPAPPAPGRDRPIGTADGTEVQLGASIAGTTGIRHALAAGATRIGLVRSELLLPDDIGRPNTDIYRRVFAALLNLAAPLPVTVRLLDLAPDKWPAWLADADAAAARGRQRGSQLFGQSSIRALLDMQLAALAALDAPPERLRLIWPSGAPLETFLRFRDDTRRRLPGVALGAMVESPLELLALDRWRAEADFVAIGSNDLLQHLCAADRDDPAQRHQLDPYRPELFRFLGEALREAPEQVQICGLLPQIEGLLPVLVGLGCRGCSVEPMLIPLLARDLAGRTLDGCRALAVAACAAATGAEVRELLGVPADRPWGLVRAPAAATGEPG
jgi:phosphoenolpyruvate-protein kinase (PTS system EI component)